MFVPKEFDLGNSTDVRLYATILQDNDPDDWILRLYAELGLPPDRVNLLKEFNGHRSRRTQEQDAHALFEEFRAQRRNREANAEHDRIQHHIDIANNIPMLW